MECLSGDAKVPLTKMVEIQPYEAEFRYLLFCCLSKDCLSQTVNRLEMFSYNLNQCNDVRNGLIIDVFKFFL